MESKSRKYTNKNVFHPVLEHKSNKRDNVITVLRNVQKHVLQNQIDIGQFFEPFDPHNKGFVTEDQFRRCLDSIGVSSLHRLYYSEPELALLMLMFRDDEHPERIRWRKFEDEINTVFVRKNLEKTPELEVECPPRDVKEMHRKGGKDWESIELHSRQLFDRTVTNIRNFLRQRRILLEPYFKVFDKNNHGHIPRSTFRRALSTAGIQYSDEELRVLEKRFMNVDGFNYLEFLVMIKDLQEENIEPECNKKLNTDADITNTERISSKPKKLTLASLISKIQIIVKRGRIKVDQFLRQFDSTNHRIIVVDNFLRGIAMSGIRLESAELNLLCDEFSSKENPGYVDYQRFCNTIEQAFTTLGLEQNPSANPKEYLTTYEGPSNYLTEEQKIAVDSALSKLCSTPNNGLDDLFKDYDKYRQGIVTEEVFLGALTVSKLNMLISLFEIKSLIKGFSKEDYPQAFNYRTFMKAIEYKQKVLAESNSNQ